MIASVSHTHCNSSAKSGSARRPLRLEIDLQNISLRVISVNLFLIMKVAFIVLGYSAIFIFVSVGKSLFLAITATLRQF